MKQDKIQVLYMVESMKAGGAERQLHEILTGLDRNRFGVRLITWIAEAHAFEPVTYRWDQFVRKSKFDLTPVYKASELLKSGQVDIVHGFLDTGNLYAVLAGLWAGKGKAIASERSSGRRLTMLQRWHKPWSHKKAALTVSNSGEGKKFLQQLGVPDQKIKVIPNGVDDGVFAPIAPQFVPELRVKLGLDPDRPLLLCVGRVAPLKNQVAVVEAFGKSQIKDKYHLVIIGGDVGGYQQQVEAMISKMQLEDRVHLMGLKNNVEQFYQAANILVLFSSREGTPNAVLEAMACGLPCVVTDVGDCPRYVKQDRSGWIIAKGDQARLREIFDKIGNTDKSTLEAMGREGQKLLSTLKADKKSMLSNLESLYISLLNGSQ